MPADTQRWNSPKVVDAPSPFRSPMRRSIDATNRRSTANLPGPIVSRPTSARSGSAQPPSPLQDTLDSLHRGGKKRFAVAPSILAAEEAAASPRPGRRLSTTQPQGAAAPPAQRSLFSAPVASTPPRGLSPAPSPSPSGREGSQRRPLSRDARPITSLTPDGKAKHMSAFCVEVGRGRGQSPSHRNHVVSIGSAPSFVKAALLPASSGSSPKDASTGTSAASPTGTSSAQSTSSSPSSCVPPRPTRLFWKNAETAADSDRGHWKPVVTKRCPSPHTQTLVGVMSPCEMPKTKPHRVVPPYGTEP